MKVYEVGEQGKPVLMLFPGTGCYWRSNFGKAINPAGTEIHILYALKMGEKYRARYHRHFAHPVLHELDMQHEELLAVHPKEWVELIEDICRQK